MPICWTGCFFAAGPRQLVVKALKLLQWLQYNHLNQGHVWSSVHTLCFQETSNLHWFGWPIIGKPLEGFHVQKILIHADVRSMRSGYLSSWFLKNPYGLTSPSPHHHGTSIELPNISRPKLSCSKKCHAQRNGCSSFRRIMSRAQLRKSEMLAPHSVGWGSVCNTTQNSIMSSGGSMQGIPLIHSIGLWVLPVDL